MLFRLNEDNVKWADFAKINCLSLGEQIRRDYDDFVNQVASHVKKSGGTLEIIVNNAKKGGVSFRGANGRDFVWVHFKKGSFHAQATYGLRSKGFDRLTKPLYAKERGGWQELARQVSEAHDFCVRTLGSKKTFGATTGSRVSSLMAATPGSKMGPNGASVTQQRKFDVEGCAGRVATALVALAKSKRRNGFKKEDIASLKETEPLTGSQLERIISELCKRGALAKESSEYYLADPFLALASFDQKRAAPEMPPERTQANVSRIVRDSAITRNLKAKYGYRCQICGKSLKMIAGLYAEVHHLRPLGAPHNGLDRIDNMIVVCPNHHAQLDYGAISVKVLKLGLHNISDASIRYHNERIFGKG